MNWPQIILLVLGSIITVIVLYYLARFLQVGFQALGVALRWIGNAPAPFKFIIFILTFGVIGFIINWIIAANVVCADLGRGDVGVAPYKLGYFDALAAKAIPPTGIGDLDVSSTQTGSFLTKFTKFFSSAERGAIDGGTKQFGTIITTVGDPEIDPPLSALSVGSDLRGAAVMWPESVLGPQAMPTVIAERDTKIMTFAVYGVYVGSLGERRLDSCVLAPHPLTQMSQMTLRGLSSFERMANIQYTFYPIVAVDGETIVAVDAKFSYANDGKGAYKGHKNTWFPSWDPKTWFKSETYGYWTLVDCPRKIIEDVVCRDSTGAITRCGQGAVTTSRESVFTSRKMVLPQGVGLGGESGWVIATYKISGSGEYSVIQSPLDVTLSKNPRAFFIATLKDGYDVANKPGAALQYSCNAQTYDVGVRLFNVDVFGFKTILMVSAFAILFMLASWLRIL